METEGVRICVCLKRNLFLTGRKSADKFKILSLVFQGFPISIGGFRVDGVYEGRRLRGFEIVDLSTLVSARVSTARRGGWDIHTEAFDTIGVQSIKEAVHSADLVVMGGLGRFEISARKFRQAVNEALESPVPVLGIIKEHSNPFLDEIRNRKDIQVLRTTDENNNEIRHYIEDWLHRILIQGKIYGRG